jgi:hypothetical protein
MSLYPWVSPLELADLPEHAPLDADAAKLAVIPIDDQDTHADRYAMAAAMKAAREDDAELMRDVEDVLLASMGSEVGGRALALARNLQAIVVAGSLIGWTSAENEQRFRAWIAAVRRAPMEGGPRDLIVCHEERPNNWGTHAGAARLAAAIYLGDWAEVRRCAQVLAGWLGMRRVYSGFKYGDLDWQGDKSAPVGINLPGAMIQGHSVDGVLPDDQRRGGGFTWPPPKENYVYEAMQGIVPMLVMLGRLGRPGLWYVKKSAPLRAYRWLHNEAGYPSDGDDTSQIPIINAVYKTSFPHKTPTTAGKGMLAYTEWLVKHPGWLA